MLDGKFHQLVAVAMLLLSTHVKRRPHKGKNTVLLLYTKKSGAIELPDLITMF